MWGTHKDTGTVTSSVRMKSHFPLYPQYLKQFQALVRPSANIYRMRVFPDIRLLRLVQKWESWSAPLEDIS